jgi:hypothetical protein
MNGALVVAMAAFATAAFAVPPADGPIGKFSGATVGEEIPKGWEKVTLPYGKKSEFRIVEDGPTHVLQVRSAGAFGSLAFRLSESAGKAPILSWRWKVDHVVEKAQIETKEGEDFAARVYVAFDIPESELSTGDRTKIKMAQVVQGFVPTAAICYVWDNKHPVGTSLQSPYFTHVRTIVLQSGNGRAGKWVKESRDVEADFVAAFGAQWKGKVPKISGVITGNDTDQTGETVTAWFGDLQLGPRKK